MSKKVTYGTASLEPLVDYPLILQHNLEQVSPNPPDKIANVATKGFFTS